MINGSQKEELLFYLRSFGFEESDFVFSVVSINGSCSRVEGWCKKRHFLFHGKDDYWTVLFVKKESKTVWTTLGYDSDLFDYVKIEPKAQHSTVKQVAARMLLAFKKAERQFEGTKNASV